MSEADLHILVSGASVSGLSAAYWLSQPGFKVTVVEQAQYLRPGGQALDVRGTAALEVARRMGILDTIRERRTKLKGVSLVDGNGKEIYHSTERTLTGSKFDRDDIEILRDHLIDVLFDAVEDGVEYMFSDSIASLTQDDSGVDVTFENGPARRFDLVIGADGLRSKVRRLSFGPDEQFIKYLGSYIAVCAIPNFLGLDHWQIFCQEDGRGGGLLVMDKADPARTYLGFSAEEPIDYDYRDVEAQKQVLADRLEGLGWVFPEIVKHMRASTDFYMDSINQIHMDRWSNGRVALLGDAGYAVSLATGQGTSVAMIAAYVLAGELAAHRGDLLAGLRAYEDELRAYVTENQELATQSNLPDAPPADDEGGDGMVDADSLPDFGEQAVPFDLKDYHLS